MKIDQQSIEVTLQLIASGQLDPLQAARQILGLQTVQPLGSTQQPTLPLQTIDSLVRSLGFPPPEIEHDWRQQIESLARHWQQRHRSPLPALELTDVLIDTNNRLSLRPGLPSGGLPSGGQRCRSRDLTPEPQPCDLIPTPQGTVAAPADPVLLSVPLSRRRQAAVAAIAFALCAATVICRLALHRTGSQGESPLLSAKSRDHSPALAQEAPPQRSEPIADDQRRARDSLPPDPDRLADASPGTDGSQRRGNLRSGDPLLAESQWDAGPDWSDIATGESSGEQDDFTLAPFTLASGVDPVAGEADAETTEASVQEAHASEDRPTLSSAPSEALTLPPLPPPGESFEGELIFPSPVGDVRWDFPVPTTVTLRPLAPHSWALVDDADDAELAFLRTSDAGLRFLWAGDAESKSAARQLAAGRLQLTGPALGPGITKTLWLRPQLQSEPLGIDFSGPQMSASWPLSGPPIFPGGELSVEVDMPDSVQLNWIEPLDPQNLRRNVSVLQWTATGDSTPAIRCRIELRVTTRLALRLRYAVQLDPSMPWQPFSARQLTAAADRVTVALNRSLVDQNELSRRYRAANTTGKRLLKPAKESLDQNVLRMQTLLQRLGQLDALQASLTAGADIRIGLRTQWPDGDRQTILQMSRP